MALVFGRNTFCLLADESAWGTPGAYSGNQTRIISTTLQSTQQRDRQNEISSSDGGFSKSFFDTFTECGGQIVVPFSYSGVGMFLRSTFGTATTSGSYTHKYDSSVTDLPSFAMKLQRGSDANGMEEFKGLCVTNAEFALESGGEFIATFDLIGKESATRGTKLNAVPVDANNVSAFHYEVTTDITYNSVTYKAQNFSLNIDNKLERRNLLGSRKTAKPCVSDFREVVLSAEFDLESNDLYNNMLTGTESSVELILTQTGTTNKIKIFLSNAIITDYSDNISSVGRLTRSVTWQALATASADAAYVEITNAVASAIAS